jgi:hypothetical protein
MAVISITVIASEQQVVAGIPRTVSISTNIPASIFYTLDGSMPTLFSTMYTGPIFMPTDSLSLTLNIMATNGVDTSLTVSETYVTNMASNTNARLPRSSTDAEAQSNIPSLYPFGTNPIQPNAAFENPADAGITVNNPDLPSSPTGFDENGDATGFTNEPYDLTNYSIKYTTTDNIGQTGYGIGSLPASVKIEMETPPPDTTDQNSNMFDPRALVIFQDVSKENPNDPPHINRIHFSLENSEKSRDGNNFYTTGLDAPPVNGSFLRSHYNPRTNAITYYYLDTWANRWIISTMPYNPNSNVSNISGATFVGGGAGKVFEWIPYARRTLF